jgi:hypothetical protein
MIKLHILPLSQVPPPYWLGHPDVSNHRRVATFSVTQYMPITRFPQWATVRQSAPGNCVMLLTGNGKTVLLPGVTYCAIHTVLAHHFYIDIRTDINRNR